MRRIAILTVLVVGTLLGFGSRVVRASVVLESSTFTPAPGNSVSVFVRGAPVGATFLWDLDGDGVYERTTPEPLATFIMPQGARRVRVEVVSGGRSVAHLAALFVADPRLGATRTVVAEGGSWAVTVTLNPRTTLLAAGFVEEIPGGFALEVVDEGGAFWRRAERLEVVWAHILDPGQTVSFTYRLYPLSGVSFQFSGLVSAYVEGKRVEIPIAGAVSP